MQKLEDVMLSEIVLKHPDSAVVLEKYHLDFCCKGRQTINDVMKGREDEINNLLEELKPMVERGNNGNSMEGKPLSEIIDYIIDEYHADIKSSSPVIIAHLEKIASKHGDRHPELVKISDMFRHLITDLDQHMMKEEMVLFPAIKNKENGGNAVMMKNFSAPVKVMLAEHDNAGEEMHEIRSLTNNYTPPSDACTTYRLAFEELKTFEERLHLHVHLENSELFPRALQLGEVSL